MVQVDLECGHSYRRLGMVPDKDEKAVPSTVVERECRTCNPPRDAEDRERHRVVV
jgi:hypothetical protein